ncbi:MAG: helix-turn-helix transcriptional regulator [Nitrospiraceae bacterium]|nr:helix-turn-helix transcriptional regulator [Nitrospiraceae bacterium]
MGKDPIYNFSELENPAYEIEIVSAIGRNIRNLRLARKMTQDELGSKAGISANYLGEIERGEKNPTGLVIFKLANVLQASVLEIMPDVENNGLFLEIERIFKGKKHDDLKKAVRMMECFLEIVSERGTKNR